MEMNNRKERNEMNKKISRLAPSKIKWRNLPAIDIVTKTLVYNTPCDETFEKRLSAASEKLCYTKSEIEAIRNRRKNFFKVMGRDRQGFL